MIRAAGGRTFCVGKAEIQLKFATLTVAAFDREEPAEPLAEFLRHARVNEPAHLIKLLQLPLLVTQQL